MILRLMKASTHIISIPRRIGFGLAIWWMAGSAIAAVGCSTQSGVSDHAGETYPNFCSIPETPRDVRKADAFKAAVLDSRIAGARMVKQTDAASFTLSATPVFESSARRAAQPPPPMLTAADADTAAFVQAAKAEAAPPSRPH